MDEPETVNAGDAAKQAVLSTSSVTLLAGYGAGPVGAAIGGAAGAAVGGIVYGLCYFFTED